MDYKKNLPGETLYDKAYTDRVDRPEEQSASAVNAEQAEAQEATDTSTRSVVYDMPPQTKEPEKPTPDLKKHFATASLVLGIASVLVLFVIPLAGIVLSIVGAVLGIVFGIFSYRQHPGFCRSGIILSIIALFLSLVALVVLCIIGWSAVSALVWYLSESGANYLPYFYR